MTAPKQAAPLVCTLGAIPAKQRLAHIALALKLFRWSSEGCEELENGYAFRFPAQAFDAVARFVGNERRCCPAIRFEIVVGAANGPLELRMTGPEGTREFLAAELPLARAVRSRLGA